MHLPDINPVYSISGFLVGMLVGMTGVGGAALMTPLLVLLFGVQPTTAVGTDLLFASFTKMGGTLVHGLSHTVDWKITRRLALGSVPATGLTLLLLTDFSHRADQGVSGLIRPVLGFALILTAVTLVFRKWLLELFATRVGKLEDGHIRLLTISLGAFLGVLVSLSSVGAGAIGVTVLLILYPRLEMAKIVGSDIAHAMPLALMAGMGHWFLGSIDWNLLGFLLVGSLPGVAVGSYISARVPDRVLRPILAATLALVGSRLAF
jgi:uncharacterized membrane protein YfcA